MSQQSNECPLLQMTDVEFTYPGSNRKIIKGVSLDLQRNTSYGLIGESTCGKTTLGKIIARLVPHIDAGRVEFNSDGQNIYDDDDKNLYEYRRKVHMVFQNPDAALNPGMKIGAIIREALKAQNKRLPRKSITDMTSFFLQKINLSDQHKRFPDSLSGGEKRRVGIARALAVEPELIIADEPFANLDASLRNQVIKLFGIQPTSDNNIPTYLFILHNIDVAKAICDTVFVMYLGKIVEVDAKPKILSQKNPIHPYTVGLIEASVKLQPSPQLYYLLRYSPLSSVPPDGCSFRTRCFVYNNNKIHQSQKEMCETEEPTLKEIEQNHDIACHFPYAAYT